MNMILSGDAEEFIHNEVTSGRYDFAQEVVREGAFSMSAASKTR